ncbi:uncharacterized protein BYT42DRAFT_584638 [Radiomyces spectabilis]|uniref:uncharacterized protein n=1 Tax=Radiomyces spectabilis TaxID=64574 RepID=UPI002220B850|nr:uncharacterized protein BYT42DRAFT_584638 [Radiomyces spectabilis]KAI8369488.1 hypothetical protein BYT42DRAFT_584638 [Radiomyces spectabilis]
MDLNICLYCEKHLPEDNMIFCSTICQDNEASKKSYVSYSYRMLAQRPFTTEGLQLYELSYPRRNSGFPVKKFSSNSSLPSPSPSCSSFSSLNSSLFSFLEDSGMLHSTVYNSSIHSDSDLDSVHTF